MNCGEYSKQQICEYVDRALSVDDAAAMEAHLADCPQCALLVSELQSASVLVRSLDRSCAPVGFESRLRERIVAERASTVPEHKQPVSHRIISIDISRWRPRVLKPALAGLACAVLLMVALLVGQIYQPTTNAMDWAFIDTCREQHASFASTNPLADDSAVILRERAQHIDDR